MNLTRVNDELNAEARRLWRRVRELVRANRQLLQRAERAESERLVMAREVLRADAEVEAVREFMAETGLCPHCRRALRAAAMVEAA